MVYFILLRNVHFLFFKCINRRMQNNSHKASLLFVFSSDRNPYKIILKTIKPIYNRPKLTPPNFTYPWQALKSLDWFHFKPCWMRLTITLRRKDFSYWKKIRRSIWLSTDWDWPHWVLSIQSKWLNESNVFTLQII